MCTCAVRVTLHRHKVARPARKHGKGNLRWRTDLNFSFQGPKVLNENVDVLFDLIHDPDSGRAAFCTKDGMRNALVNRGEGFNIRRRAYATDEMKKAFVERMKKDGFEAPMCCEPPSNFLVPN